MTALFVFLFAGGGGVVGYLIGFMAGLDCADQKWVRLCRRRVL